MTNEKLGTKRKGQIYYHRNRGRYFKGNHEIHYVLPQNKFIYPLTNLKANRFGGKIIVTVNINNILLEWIIPGTQGCFVISTARKKEN